MQSRESLYVNLTSLKKTVNQTTEITLIKRFLKLLLIMTCFYFNSQPSKSLSMSVSSVDRFIARWFHTPTLNFIRPLTVRKRYLERVPCNGIPPQCDPLLCGLLTKLTLFRPASYEHCIIKAPQSLLVINLFKLPSLQRWCIIIFNTCTNLLFRLFRCILVC